MNKVKVRILKEQLMKELTGIPLDVTIDAKNGMYKIKQPVLPDEITLSLPVDQVELPEGCSFLWSSTLTITEDKPKRKRFKETRRSWRINEKGEQEYAEAGEMFVEIEELEEVDV